MSNVNLLEIYYDRVVTSEQVTLTSENCDRYGYVETTITIKDKVYQAFYKKGTTEVIEPSVKDGVATTIILYETFKKHTHIAPPPSKYEYQYADVDKEGSGRNSLTGEMFRERIGWYSMLTISWDLIPNSKEYNNWYRILTKLPPKVYLKLLTPNGVIEERAYYRGDVSTNLYLFVKDAQMWQGLSTTFTQWDVENYDDTLEPNLEDTETNESINTLTMVKVSKDGIIKQIQEHNLDEYLNLGWVLVE